tara:strand:- start:4226 stop:4810 length:585 start_codon:yes stop_codon:yes gene_type:complete
MSEVDISELFEVPDELKDKIKQKKPKVKKELSDERKAKLREQLARGRETARKNREAKLANSTKVVSEPSTKVASEPEVENNSKNIPEVEPDTEVDTTATETHSDVEPEIKNTKNKDNQKKLGNIIAKRKQTINDLVEQRVNQKFKEMQEKHSNNQKPIEKKVQIIEPPKSIPKPAPPIVKPKVIRRTFKKFPWE